MGQRKYLSASNILFVLLMAAALVTTVNPVAKSYVIRGLMTVGLFKPNAADYHDKSAGKMPDYGYKSSTGAVTALSQLKNKVVFINYWATWCPPCIAEMPAINSLYQKFKNNPGVVFIMVDVDNNLPKALSFMNHHGYNLPLYTTLSQFPDSLLDGTIPTTLILGTDGRLKYRHTGAAKYDDRKFIDFLNKQITQPGAQ